MNLLPEYLLNDTNVKIAIDKKKQLKGVSLPSGGHMLLVETNTHYQILKMHPNTLDDNIHVTIVFDHHKEGNHTELIAKKLFNILAVE